MSRKNGNSAFRKTNNQQFNSIYIDGKIFQILRDKISIKPKKDYFLSEQERISLLRQAGKKGIISVLLNDIKVPLTEYCDINTFGRVTQQEVA